MLEIRPAVETDAQAICDIYNPYVANTVVTFEQELVTRDAMRLRVNEIEAAGLPWLVSASAGGLAGYAYASAWRPRWAYRYSAEVTVYLADRYQGKGVGAALYNALMDELRALGYHAAMGGIALPNPASVALHEKLGFEKVAHFNEVGYKFDRWIDVGYWQVIL